MVIHVDFSVKGMKGHTLEGIAYFYDSNKKKLKQPLTKSDYCTSSNNVCASDTDSDIPYESTHYSDFDIFIPYWAIPMFHGRHTYYVLVDFRDVDSGKWLTDNYDYVSFIGNYSGYGNDSPTPAIKILIGACHARGHEDVLGVQEQDDTMHMIVIIDVELAMALVFVLFVMVLVSNHNKKGQLFFLCKNIIRFVTN